MKKNRQEFNKFIKRACQSFAERKFVDTLKDGGKTKVFTDIEKFKTAFKKITGSFPNV